MHNIEDSITMELFINIVIVLVSFALTRAIFIVLGVGEPKNHPPGPTRLPIIGNLHLLGDQPHRSLAKLAKIHGPIMSLKLGQVTVLVISSVAAAKEVLQKQDLAFANRHVPDGLNAHRYCDYSAGFLPVGTKWRFLRKILNSNIFSAKSLDTSQDLRIQKVTELVEYCRKASLSNDSVDIGRAAFRTSLNLISNTIFSKDLSDPNEDSDKEFKEVVGSIMVEAGKPNLVDYFPFLKKIDPQGSRKRLTQHFGKILDIFEELIEERLALGISNKDDVLDVCLKIREDNPDEMNRTQIKFIFVDMFTAGTDTTSSIVEWAMTEVLRHPHIMAKAKEELEAVIGKGKIIKEDDVIRLPYLSCIVKETFRVHPPAPLLLPRKVMNQVKLDKYNIPKGTQVLVNVWAIGQDPTIWKDSREFKPERFLNSHIDVRGQDFELIPFGAGRRMCPGLPLATRTIPMILGSLLNNFDWNVDMKNQSGEWDMSEKFGITLQKANPLCVFPKPLK